MDGPGSRPTTPVLGGAPRPQWPSRPSRPGSRPGQLTTAWAALLGVGWPLVFALTAAVEPAPDQPEAAPALIDQLLTTALLAGLMATCIAAATRHRAAATAAVATGVGLLGLTLTCPLTGHHEYGLWWIAQLALLLPMLAVSVAALGSRATTTGAPDRV